MDDFMEVKARIEAFARPLHRPTDAESAEVVRRLANNSNGLVPPAARCELPLMLLYAADVGFAETVKTILTHFPGLVVQVPAALTNAVGKISEGHQNVVRTLVEMYPENVSPDDVLDAAIREDSVVMAKLALDLGADIHHHDELPLGIAISEAHGGDVLRFLLKNGADLAANDYRVVRGLFYRTELSSPIWAVLLESPTLSREMLATLLAQHAVEWVHKIWVRA